MTITDKAVPNVVGVDIGCGMYMESMPGSEGEGLYIPHIRNIAGASSALPTF